MILSILAAAFVLAAPAQAADPASTGRWSPLQTYPVTPISAAVTADGKIVAWDQADPNPPHGISPNNGKAVIIDPNVGVIARSVNLAPTSVFCPLITTLPDGKVAIVGGGNNTYNSDKSVLFDPVSKTFGAWGSISRGRWYGGGNIDARSNIVTLGGRGGDGADVVDATTGLSRRLNVKFGADWYPHLLRAPDGRFLVENISQVNTPTRGWLDINGAGTLSSIGDTTLLQNRRRLTSTSIGPFQTLMIAGGSSTAAYIVDLSSGAPVFRPTGSTRSPHMTGTSVTLPDGSAMVIGGNIGDSETLGTPVMTPELWSPATGRWTPLEDSPKRRLYHSVAALLPDGRVWSAGSSASGQNEYNGAYFSPPYLFKKDGSGALAARPTLSGAPSRVAWGERFSVTSPDAARIRSVALIRLAATTHQYAFDQVYVPLEFSRDGDRLALRVPENGNAIPAGQYMLFLTDQDGVPSKAPTIEVTPTADTPPAPITTQSTMYVSAWGQPWKAFDGDTRNDIGGLWNGSHTDLQTEPWWQVDLGRSRDLERITLYNRTDRYGTRLRGAWVFASDEPFTSTGLAATRAQPGVTAVQITNSPGATVEVPISRSARYLRVQLPRTDYLHLREVVPRYAEAPSAKLAVTKLSETDGETVVQVTNGGNAEGAVTSVTLPGAGWRQTAGPGAPFTIAAGGQTTLTLARGAVDGDLVLGTAGGGTLKLALTAPPAPPAPVPSFSVQKTGQTDTEVTVRVTNSGTAAGAIERVALPGAGWSQVSGPGAPFSVPAGGAAVLTLARGVAGGDLVLTPSAGDPLRLALDPVVPAGAPAFTVSPGSLAFSARIGRSSAVSFVTVTNTGTAPGAPAAIALSANTSAFGITSSTCGTVVGNRSVTNLVTLGPGGSCTVGIGFLSSSLLPSYGTLAAAGATVTLSGRTRLF